MEEKIMSLRDVLYAIFKWKRLIVFVFSLIVLSAAVFSFLSPPIYEARAKVLLKKERPDIILTTEKSDGINRPITTRDVMAEMEIIKSQSLLERVVEINNLDKEGFEKDKTMMAFILMPLKVLRNIYYRIHSKKELTDREKSIYELSRRFKVKDIKNSDIIEITYEGKSAELAKKIVNSLTEQYINYRLNLYGTSQANVFFQKQLSILKDNLDRSTKALRAFQERNNSLATGVEKDGLLTKLTDFESSLRMAEVEEEEYAQSVAFLEKEITKMQKGEKVDAVGVSNRVLDNLKEQLMTLQMQRTDLLQRYTEKHPQVIAVEREINSLKEMIARQEQETASLPASDEGITREFVAQELVQAQAKLASAKVRKRTLKDQVEFYKGRIKENQNQGYTLKELEGKVKTDEDAYNLYLDKLKESEVFLELDKMKIINASVLQYADTPLVPVKPRKGRNMALAAVLGFMLSFGSVLLLEYFNHGLKNQEEAERFLKLKVIASIPYKNGR